MTTSPAGGPAGRWDDLRPRVISAIVMVAVGAAEIWLGGPSFAVLVLLLTAGMILELYRAAANAGLDQDDFFALIKWHSGISAQ